MPRKESHDQEMPFLEHLEELRRRLIKSLLALGVGMIACFSVAKYILNILTYPASRLTPPLEFQFLKVQGILVVYLEIGFFGGLMVALPYILMQIWQFVSPGLKTEERRYFLPLIFSSTILFALGLSFAYFILLPFALKFFVGLAPANIVANIAIDFYIGFALRMIFLFGVVFELPVVCYFLAKAGIITAAFMRKYRRHAIVLIFIIAAVLTPPDPITQIILGIPLTILYEASIFIVKWVEKSAERRALAGEASLEKPLETEQGEG